jgi:hypothetical protein
MGTGVTIGEKEFDYINNLVNNKTGMEKRTDEAARDIFSVEVSEARYDKYFEREIELMRDKSVNKKGYIMKEDDYNFVIWTKKGEILSVAPDGLGKIIVMVEKTTQETKDRLNNLAIPSYRDFDF